MSRGTVSGNGIVTDGLVLSLDAANPKSYVSGSTVWMDLTANTISGSFVNGPGFNISNGGSILFDGVDDYIKISKAVNFIPRNDITVCGWQYLVARDSTLLMCSDGSGNNELIVYNSSDKIRVSFAIQNPASTLISNITPPLNTWTYISVTRSSDLVSLYVNSIFDNSNTQSGAIIPGVNSPLLIGVDADSGDEGSLGNYFTGRMSYISIYNRALSAQEILQNYNATKTRFGL